MLNSMKTPKILAVFIFILLASGAAAKASSPGPRNMNSLKLTEQSFHAETKISNRGEGFRKLLSTRKKLIYFLESDPMKSKLQLNRSGGAPRLNLC